VLTPSKPCSRIHSGRQYLCERYGVGRLKAEGTTHSPANNSWICKFLVGAEVCNLAVV